MAIVSRATVKDVILRTHEIREYVLMPDKYTNYEAGQFLQLTLESVTASDYWPESRTFSIASYKSSDKAFRLIIKKVGEYTKKFFKNLEVGSQCTIKYAYGDFILPIFDEINDIICVAGGTGISPFLSFVDAVEEKKQLGRLKILYSAKTVKDFIDRDSLSEKLSKDQLVLFTTREIDEGTINRRISLEDIVDYTSNYKDNHYFICGSKSFTINYKSLLENKGVNNVYIDEWE